MMSFSHYHLCPQFWPCSPPHGPLCFEKGGAEREWSEILGLAPAQEHRLEARQRGKMCLWPGELNAQAAGGAAVTGQLWLQGCRSQAWDNWHNHSDPETQGHQTGWSLRSLPFLTLLSSH